MKKEQEIHAYLNGTKNEASLKRIIDRRKKVPIESSWSAGKLKHSSISIPFL